MPTLHELEATFLCINPDNSYQMIDDLSKAQGIQFLCPKCYVANGNSNKGTHQVLCWFRNKGVPDDLNPKPGRWTPSGTGYDDLTFVPSDPPRAVSVLLTSGCGWHGHVTNGEVI